MRYFIESMGYNAASMMITTAGVEHLAGKLSALDMVDQR